MYHLSVINSLNARAPKHAAPALSDRACSYCTTRAGLILHSAIQRSTLFVGRETPDFNVLVPFLVDAPRHRVDACIEAYFSDSVPTAAAAVAIAKRKRKPRPL